MKILLIGEYSNVHATLATGLRQLGHEVTVISNGDFWKDYPRDIDVSRKPGKIGGFSLIVRLYTLLPHMHGYDVVQLINPMFFELSAERLFWFYRFLRRHNGKLVLGAFGMDYYWVHQCITTKPLRYSDFNFGDQLRNDPEALRYRSDWTGTAKERLNRMIAEDCDAIVTGLYEYHVCYAPLFPKKTTFIPYPVTPFPNPSTDRVQKSKVNIFIGINSERSVYKGTDIMLKAAQEIRDKMPQRTKLNVAESVPFEQYQQMLAKSDILLDQLYAYTPAMNALLAMSRGIIVVGGGEPENYDIIHEDQLRPIINVEPSYESVYHELEELVIHPEQIPELKRQSVEYILRHHDTQKVAEQYESLYRQLI